MNALSGSASKIEWVIEVLTAGMLDAIGVSETGFFPLSVMIFDIELPE